MCIAFVLCEFCFAPCSFASLTIDAVINVVTTYDDSADSTAAFANTAYMYSQLSVVVLFFGIVLKPDHLSYSCYYRLLLYAYSSLDFL